MAYNNYFPQFYPNAIPSQAPQQSNDICWVSGENEAKSFPVAPGHSVILMNSESNVMYIKSVDLSGMASPIRIFDYYERGSEKQTEECNYITKEEFNKFKDDILNAIKQQNTFKPNYNKKPKEE